MKSSPKYNLPGIPQHIAIQSEGIHPCFFSDDDYQYYLDCLRNAASTFKCQIHAYVLMPDHVHMVLTPENEFGVSNILQSLKRRYARYIKRTYNQTVPLWVDNYKSSLIEDRNYLFACMCYLEVNPVREKMVEVPSEYKWSSYHANAYNKGAGLLRPHAMYTKLGNDSESRSKAYYQLFCSRAEVGSVHSIRNALHQELVLGSDEFKKTVTQMLRQKDHLVRAEKIIARKKAA